MAYYSVLRTEEAFFYDPLFVLADYTSRHIDYINGYQVNFKGFRIDSSDTQSHLVLGKMSGGLVLFECFLKDSSPFLPPSKCNIVFLIWFITNHCDLQISNEDEEYRNEKWEYIEWDA